MKTEDLIHALAEDRPPKTSFRRLCRLALLAAFAFAALSFALTIGPRPDFASAVTTVRFDFKFVVTLTLAASAAFLVLRLATPGASVGRRGLVLLIAPALLAVACLAELAVMPQATWLPRLIGENSRLCLTIIPLLSIGPLALILLVLRQGAPTRPALAGAAAGLLASGIAATFYAANCTDDSPLFVMTWYPMAMAMVTAVGALIGSRLLRW
ncbi:hypothetical protein HDIA_3314 [Hartmannibacter diazotrophicus]|uniref:Anti-sigma-F factor NrsF n=1 Tax=Hartmannibacter diazotrophicus TaxID=1482074 RepID=A0A2C9DB81_9HYPH|nr:NrsF family protein [Hartmannibacter diazotrophicus]SON56855.1 hypothetical protein HDIA_3314 [Hartmannibacter diazotrophicus]